MFGVLKGRQDYQLSTVILDFYICFLHIFINIKFIQWLLLQDTRKMWELRKESRNLVVQMHPNPGRNGFV
jgi:hypothetical protein